MSAEERPAGEGKVRLRVQVSGMVTQRAYESALEELGSAVQFPGFKKKRGGKSDPLPSSLILQVVGKSKVKQFAVDGLVIEAVCDYAQEKGYQVNRNLSAAGIVENMKEIRVSYIVPYMFLLSSIVWLTRVHRSRHSAQEKIWCSMLSSRFAEVYFPSYTFMHTK